MKTSSEKEKKLNLALSKLKNLDLKIFTSQHQPMESPHTDI